MIKPLRTEVSRKELEANGYIFDPRDEAIAIKGSPFDNSFAMYELSERPSQNPGEDIFELSQPRRHHDRNRVAVMHAIRQFPFSDLYIMASQPKYEQAELGITIPEPKQPLSTPNGYPQNPGKMRRQSMRNYRREADKKAFRGD